MIKVQKHHLYSSDNDELSTSNVLSKRTNLAAKQSELGQNVLQDWSLAHDRRIGGVSLDDAVPCGLGDGGNVGVRRWPGNGHPDEEDEAEYDGELHVDVVVVLSKIGNIYFCSI